MRGLWVTERFRTPSVGVILAGSQALQNCALCADMQKPTIPRPIRRGAFSAWPPGQLKETAAGVGFVRAHIEPVPVKAGQSEDIAGFVARLWLNFQ